MKYLHSYVHVVRGAWSGLATFYVEGAKSGAKEYEDDWALPSAITKLYVLELHAGVPLTDTDDPRYQSLLKHRARFGNFLHRAAVSVQQSEGDIDAVLAIIKGIDVYLLDYARTRSAYVAQQQALSVARDLSRLWANQKTFPRSIWIKRALLYHSSRLYMSATFRQRSGLDDLLLDDMAALSLSPYTRARRSVQPLNRCLIARQIA